MSAQYNINDVNVISTDLVSFKDPLIVPKHISTIVLVIAGDTVTYGTSYNDKVTWKQDLTPTAVNNTIGSNPVCFNSYCKCGNLSEILHLVLPAPCVCVTVGTLLLRGLLPPVISAGD